MADRHAAALDQAGVPVRLLGQLTGELEFGGGGCEREEKGEEKCESTKQGD